MRKKLIAANWKMYKTPEEAVAFMKSFVPLIGNQKHAEIVLCPSPVLLPAVLDAARNNPVSVGAQNMHWLDQGAYTGETSALQLKALGVTHVLIGHSERRQYFNETDESVNLKLKAALKHGLVPIVCVGEQLAEREAGQTTEVLERQTSIALSGITSAEAAPLVIAYEPVWAIGTGKTASSAQAQEAHAFIRKLIAALYDETVARRVRIQYGGSVKPANAKELMNLPDVDGALVGGASLESRSFADIIKNSI